MAFILQFADLREKTAAHKARDTRAAFPVLCKINHFEYKSIIVWHKNHHCFSTKSRTSSNLYHL